MIVLNFISIFQVKYIWTSGRLCDFKGCNRPDLLPNEINGWFWTAELQKLAPTTNRQQNDWSEGGGIGKPQPDNRVRTVRVKSKNSKFVKCFEYLC